MKNFILIISAIIIVSSALSIILNKLFRNNKYIKYILPLLLLIASLYFIILSKTTKESFLDLAYFLMFILSLAGFISSLITSLILDYRKKN